MVCVERCDVWRVKNEIVEVGRIMREPGHTKTLLNAVKSVRRLTVIDALQERPLSVKDLQQHLRKSGYRHSRSTVTNTYLKPLREAGLIKEDGGRYRLTFYGRKIREVLQGLGCRSTLPVHSCCYEEVVMKALVSGPKTFDELAALLNPKSLSRVLMRLRRRELMTQRHVGDYVFYHRAKKKAAVSLSPTEERVFESIPDVGVSARALSKSVDITLRRTYKCLRRLRAKKLVFALRIPKTYELTPRGAEIAVVLDDIMKLASQSTSSPIFVYSAQPSPFLGY